MANSLSTIGRRDLTKHEATIEAGLKTFWQVGDALTAIRDGKLYRENFDTFDAYCRGRWKFSERRARQLMATSGTMVPVSNERQARALAPLKDDAKAQEEVVEAASEDGPPTAKKIAAEVAKRVQATPTSGSSESAEDTSTSQPADAAGQDVDAEGAIPSPSPAPNAAPIDTTVREEGTAPVAVEDGAMNIVETLTDLLEPFEFESVVLCVDGSEPFVSRDMGMGLVLDLTATLRSWCECCDIDGTHHHENCEHPCCPDNDADAKQLVAS